MNTIRKMHIYSIRHKCCLSLYYNRPTQRYYLEEYCVIKIPYMYVNELINRDYPLKGCSYVKFFIDNFAYAAGQNFNEFMSKSY